MKQKIMPMSDGFDSEDRRFSLHAIVQGIFTERPFIFSDPWLNFPLNDDFSRGGTGKLNVSAGTNRKGSPRSRPRGSSHLSQRFVIL